MDDPEDVRFEQIGDQLRQRLAHRLGTNTNSHTDRINRLLILWLDLQQAVRAAEIAARAKRADDPPSTPDPASAVIPWDCNDKEIQRLWNQITHPDNRRALEEWLYQVAPPELELWAQRALLECRKRVGS